MFPEITTPFDLIPYIPRKADVMLALVTCITYDFPFPDRPHKTWYVSMIGKRPNEGVLITFDEGVPKVLRPDIREIIPVKVYAD